MIATTEKTDTLIEKELAAIGIAVPADPKQKPRQPGDIDGYIGARIVLARNMARNMTPLGLADHLGITVQQLAKYENGKNRVSASRLAEIAHYTGRRITFFFPASVLFKGDVTATERENERLANKVKFYETIIADMSNVVDEAKGMKKERT